MTGSLHPFSRNPARHQSLNKHSFSSLLSNKNSVPLKMVTSAYNSNYHMKVFLNKPLIFNMYKYFMPTIYTITQNIKLCTQGSGFFLSHHFAASSKIVDKMAFFLKLRVSWVKNTFGATISLWAKEPASYPSGSGHHWCRCQPSEQHKMFLEHNEKSFA